MIAVQMNVDDFPCYYGELDKVTYSIVQDLAKLEYKESLRLAEALDEANNSIRKARIEKDRDAEQITKAPPVWKNLCVAAIQLDVYIVNELKPLQYFEMVRVPYRGWIAPFSETEDSVFMSSERESLRTMTMNAGPRLLKDLLEISEFNRTRNALFADKTGKAVMPAMYGDKFGINDRRKFVIGGDVAGGDKLVYRYDDSEVQVLAVLKQEYGNILSRGINNIQSDSIRQIEVRCVIHSKYDPCPSCLWEVQHYIRNQLVMDTETFMPLRCKVVVIPVLSSRLHYAHKAHFSTREVLDWRRAYKLPEMVEKAAVSSGSLAPTRDLQSESSTIEDEAAAEDVPVLVGVDDTIVTKVSVLLFAVTPLDLVDARA